MDERLARVIEPVLRDLRVTDGPEPRIIEGPEHALASPDDAWLQVMFYGIEGGAGVMINLEDSELDQLVSATDHAQDSALHEQWKRHEPTNWPVCPQHPSTHPLKPVARDDQAVWVCPVTDEVIAAIGSLEA